MMNCKSAYRNLYTKGSFMAFLGAQRITIRRPLESRPVFRAFRHSGAAWQPRLQFPHADTVRATMPEPMTILLLARQRNTQRSIFMKRDSIIVAIASAVARGVINMRRHNAYDTQGHSPVQGPI